MLCRAKHLFAVPASVMTQSVCSAQKPESADTAAVCACAQLSHLLYMNAAHAHALLVCGGPCTVADWQSSLQQAEEACLDRVSKLCNALVARSNSAVQGAH